MAISEKAAFDRGKIRFGDLPDQSGMEIPDPGNLNANLGPPSVRRADTESLYCLDLRCHKSKHDASL
jgi:hypothetical protein